MGRRKIAAGNWKMHLTLPEARQLASVVVNSERPASVEVIFGVPSVFLQAVVKETNNRPGVQVSAQNCHEEEAGAFTGEISASMIQSSGASFVILGHSERRDLFGETDQLIEKKVRRALEKNLDVIFCCGEPLDVREEGKHNEWVERQLRHALFSLSAEQIARVIIAYEPIWAIGTGKTATPSQVGEMHQFIRNEINNAFGAEVSQTMPILYGGSVKPSNANSLFSLPDVDGGLVGGASLDASSFLQIIHAFPE